MSGQQDKEIGIVQQQFATREPKCMLGMPTFFFLHLKHGDANTNVFCRAQKHTRKEYRSANVL